MRFSVLVSLLLGLSCICRLGLCSGQTAAVTGAGVHGLLAGLELKQRGWAVDVYEKEPDILPVVPSITLNGSLLD